MADKLAHSLSVENILAKDSDQESPKRPIAKPRSLSSIPPPPSVPPPICPLTAQEHTTVPPPADNKDDDDDLKLTDIKLEEKENCEQEDNTVDEKVEDSEDLPREYSYIQSNRRLRGSARVREASLSPEPKDEEQEMNETNDKKDDNLQKDINSDDDDVEYDSDPEYANLFPDVTDNVESDKTDGSKYMNSNEMEKPSKPKKGRRRRPLSNYLNVAPLPEHLAPVPEPVERETETTGQPTTNSTTAASQLKVPHPRYGNLSKAPARPPEGFKKMPPIEGAIISQLPGTPKKKKLSNSSDSIKSGDVASSPQHIEKPPVKKSTSTPPVKPPRVRNSTGSPTNKDATPTNIVTSHLPPPFVTQNTPPVVSRSNDSTPTHVKAPTRPLRLKSPAAAATNTTSEPIKSSSANNQLGVAKRSAPSPPVAKIKTPPAVRKSEPSPAGVRKNDSPASTPSPSSNRKAPPSKTAVPPSRPAPPPPKKYLKQTSQESSPSISRSVPPQESVAPPLPPRSKHDVTSNEDRKEQEIKQDESSKDEDVTNTDMTKEETATSVDQQSASVAVVSDETTMSSNEGTGALARMVLLDIELTKVEGEGFGLHIAEGYAQTSKGLEVGVFVKEIVSDSCAEKSGIICESDMLVEIAGQPMIGATLEDAARVLKNSGNTVKLKIGRTISSSKSDVATPLSIEEEYEKLKQEFDTVKNELEEAQTTVTDLTQALATVTVEKTKLESKVKVLSDKVSSHEASASKSNDIDKIKAELESISKDKASLEKQVETLKGKESTLVAELDSEREAKKSLEKELEKVKENLQKEREEKEGLTKNNATLTSEISKLKKDLEKERKEKELVTKSLSEKIIELEESLAAGATSGDKEIKEKTKVEIAVQEGKEEVDKNEAVEEKTTEPIEKLETPVEEISTKKEKKREQSTERDRSSDRESKERETTPGVSDEDIFVPLSTVKCELKISAEKDRARLSAQMQRHKPSRDHVRSLANLSHFPESMPELKPFDDKDNKRVSDSVLVAPRPKLIKKPSQEDAKPPHPVAAPKPKPRPQPRKKPTSPDHQPNTTGNTKSPPPESPTVSKRPIPVPRSASKERVSSDNIDSSKQETPSPKPRTSQLIDESSPKSSPKHSPLLPPKPSKPESDVISSPKTSKKPLRPPSQDENTIEGGAPAPPPKKAKPPPPKPSPRTQPSLSQESQSEDDHIEALKRKDPSELTVKEKRLLAQQAMTKQAEYRSKGIPPPVKKKQPLLPKSSLTEITTDQSPETKRESRHDDNEEELERSMERSKSMEDIADDTTTPKKQPRKLPPGAFNIAIPVGLPNDLRQRSYTVAGAADDQKEATNDTSEVKQDSVKQDSVKQDSEEVQTPSKDKSTDNQQNHKETPQPSSEGRRASESTPQEEMESEISTPESSRKNPPSASASMDNLSGLSGDEADANDFNEAELLQGTSPSSIAQPDIEQVLYWSSDVVSMWLANIGLGSYASSFKDKSIKGYMMFDLDNSKLKGLGIASNDDRNTFKKELKALKPYADKIKKEYLKKKKEDKKQGKKKKK